MQFCDLKMSKMATADCSGVGDLVMPNTQQFHGFPQFSAKKLERPRDIPLM
jgi:hypothetical protein